ncbi:MAG: NTP transferase domain-containing protein [Armatimonadetes bacterium]|nr:NTP transferase domain-containing protein [Armatimonadota bacterium]
MKGIIIVGGLGSRLRPMTRVTNKHLLPVWRFPMVYYPLHSLVDAGVRDILIVTGGNSPGDFLELLHDGSDFGLRQLYFAYQAQPRGIADALRCAEHFVGGDSCILMLGDNILNGSIRPHVERFQEQGAGMRILLKQVPDPQRFGVPELDAQGNIVRVIEKPQSPPSPYAVIGVYMMDAQVWEILPTLELSERNQYEITDVQNEYLRRGQLRYDVIECDWSDAGTPESLYRATQLAHDSDFQPPAELAE